MDLKLIKEYTHNMAVLYVEDEVAVRKETAMLLERFFKSVDTACDGQEGLDLYKMAYDADVIYDLVVTDLRMPNLDGVSMSREILEINDEQSIIVISAHDEAEYLRPLLNLGIEQFILKPIEVESIARAFFKSCRAIYDHKMLTNYIKEIENLNDTLQDQNSALEKSMRVIQSKDMKDKLVYQQKNQENKSTPSTEVDASLHAMIHEDLPELTDLFEELDAKIVNLNSSSKEELETISELTRRYGAILSAYNVFKALSTSFNNLASVMHGTPLPDDAEKVEHILLMLESFVYTLKQWTQEWSDVQSVDTNFFDASMISDIQMITNLWLNKEEEAEVIEFF